LKENTTVNSVYDKLVVNVTVSVKWHTALIDHGCEFDVRLLQEAGTIIGRSGDNIKRLRQDVSVGLFVCIKQFLFIMINTVSHLSGLGLRSIGQPRENHRQVLIS